MKIFSTDFKTPTRFVSCYGKVFIYLMKGVYLGANTHKRDFYSNMTLAGITNHDYNYASRVWQEFK